MNDELLIFGHKNPDTDSVTSAISLAYLKTELGYKATPYVLGELSKETEFALSYFDMASPKHLKNVKIQMKDLNYDRVEPVSPENSILTAYNHMNKNKIRTLPVVDDHNHLIGIVTMKDIAMNAINGNINTINTTFDNIRNDLNAISLSYANSSINGSIIVTSFHDSTIIENDVLRRTSVVITGDRYDVIDYAIQRKVQLIIVTGGHRIPDVLIEKAAVSRVNMLVTPFDTYYTSKLINQTNFISSIMMSDRLIRFKEDEYMENCKDIVQSSKHSKFPVIDSQNRYLGIVGRTHFLYPTKKKVILVDHNEYAQSADGLNEADVLEIIDHHKLGDISTALPIVIRSMPVGSTNTILCKLYKESNVPIPKNMAGIMLSGIISDTLYLKSPTTTPDDIESVKYLSDLAGIETSKFAMELFKSGTSLVGRTVEEIFHNDFKSFIIEGYKIGISQVFTLNFSEILDDQTTFLNYIKGVQKNSDYYITLMLVTDIIKEGSYVMFSSAHDKLLSVAFNQTIEQGTFIPNCVSRKKQIIPKLIQAIKLLK
ncbi:putative manganese-dependent inorganic diphosphatase [Fusibacter tunisiensis]|uniref:inorganic diphosphatase n=1 Tax=Fusibacter tunisiensis TaxID=1008308 RepID=A0ABS2MMM2_9FIRM|nr:putative manganese-dependent inorganic diphosphatase [Fusibacter tunisiensis]MBM7560655.1 manganese-dependent inorganic pyrophosphatase [Fusibacter tunisiensis]